MAAAVATAVLGVTLVVAGAALPSERMRTGANGFVNNDRPSLNAHNSPAVAADPTRPRVLAAASRIDTPQTSCAVARSENGGVSWEPLDLPLAAGAPNCYFPDVAFDGAGRLLVVYTATGGPFNRPVGVWLQAFDREGGPDGPAVRVAGQSAFQARLAVRDERVLVAWVQAGPASFDRALGLAPEPNPLVLARSEDGGRTFSDASAISEPARRVVQPSVVVGPDDHVLVGALDLGDDNLDYEAAHDGRGGPPADGHWGVVTWTSTDGGATFGPAAVVDDGLVIPQRIIVEFAPTPGFARVGSRIYATWDAGRGDDRDVFLSRSDDDGATWSPAVRVAPRPQAQFLPAVDVAPDGRVDLVFYDRSGDPDDVLTEVVLASSRDGGASFATLTVSDRPFDSTIGLGSLQGIPVLSSQLAVVAQADSSAAFWADTRHGDVTTNVQDLAVALVEQGRAAPVPRTALVGGGAALALVATVVALRRGRAATGRGQRTDTVPTMPASK